MQVTPIKFPHEGITHLISEDDMEQAVFDTLEEFKSAVASTAFSEDEVGFWAMEEDGKKYKGPSVRTPKPHWATHVYWFGA